MYNTVGLGPTVTIGAPDESSEILVYTSLRPGNWDIYLFDNLDAEPRRLTDDPNLDYNAVLSHDGRWVVFVSERDGNANLYALDLTSKLEPIRLTAYSGMDDAPTLSPDGTQLAFVSTRNGNPDIFIMPFAPGDMTPETRAVNITNNPYGDFNPAFSPDGSRIAFSSNRAIFRQWNPLRLIPFASAVTDIYLMNTDGSMLQRVISALAISGAPAWTSHGQGLLYYQAGDPAEAGNGKWVVFTSDRAGWMDEWFLSGRFAQPYGELYAVLVDGSGPAIKLTDDKMGRLASVLGQS